jgi:hypothetical protein
MTCCPTSNWSNYLGFEFPHRCRRPRPLDLRFLDAVGFEMAFLLAHKSNGAREKGRLTATLPSYSSAVHEKFRQAYYGPWILQVTVSIPCMRSRRLPLPVPNLVRLHHITTARLSRRRGLLLLGLVTVVAVFIVITLSKRFGPQKREWPKLISDPPTLVFRRDDLQRIWKWEVESGHHPSSRKSEFQGNSDTLSITHRILQSLK